MRLLEEILGSKDTIIEQIHNFAIGNNREAGRAALELFLLYLDPTTSNFDRVVAEEAIVYQLIPVEKIDKTEFNRFGALTPPQILGVVYSYECERIAADMEREAEKLITQWFGKEEKNTSRLKQRNDDIPWNHTVSLRPRQYEDDKFSFTNLDKGDCAAESGQEYDMTARDLEAVCRRFDEFNLTHKEVMEAIRSACDFFRIPYPELVYDLTDSKGGRTMFLNNNSNDMANDILCYNMDQLIGLNVNSKDSFSLIMTHECAHRVFQKVKLPGVANGIWEHELLADFFMGIRAGLWSIDFGLPMIGLFLTQGSPTHPEGMVRGMFIRHGKYLAQRMLMEGKPKTIEYIFNKFLEYREEMMDEIINYQSKYYDIYERSSTSN